MKNNKKNSFFIVLSSTSQSPCPDLLLHREHVAAKRIQQKDTGNLKKV